MRASERVGVVVDGRLGLLGSWRPATGPRLIDLRMIPSDTPLSEVWDAVRLQESDWVLVPASRAAEVPKTIGELVIWRSPVCPLDAVDRVLAQRPAAIFVSDSAELADRGDRVTRILTSGWEAGGVVGAEGTLVLLRRLLQQTDREIWLVGGLGPDAAAGAIACGATGVLLADVLWATPEADAPASLLQLLERFDPVDTDALGRFFDFEVRVFRQLATKPPRWYEAHELQRASEPQHHAAAACWQHLLSVLPDSGVDPRSTLLPLGQSAALACRLRDRFGHAQPILEHFAAVIETSRRGLQRDYPFVEGSRLAQQMGLRFPLFQGPMSQVADVAAFIDGIGRSGAMPWVAFSNMPDYVAVPLLREVTETMDGRPFGVNIIGMDSNRYRDAHMELLFESPPPYVMVGAGTTEQALAFESHGIPTFIHTPVPAMLRTALRHGLRRFILEGSEAGGHVGKLGSVSLWQYAIDVLLEEAKEGIDLDTVTVVLAGGLCDQRSAQFAAAMVYRLHSLGVSVGLQMGTAYLLTNEAVESGAVSPVFQEMAAASQRTRLMGRTVNTPTRVLESQAAAGILHAEDERLRKGVGLSKRKHYYEDDNFGGLRAAAKAQKIEFTDETRKHVRMVDIDRAEQRERGLFHAGQTVALMDRVRPAVELNLEMCAAPTTHVVQPATAAGKNGSGRSNGQAVPIVHRPTPDARASRVDTPGDDAVAIIGLGVKVPGALDVATFWSNIERGVVSVTEVPTDVWDPALYWSDDRSAPDKTYSKIGGFVRGFEFDRKRFRIPPSVVQSIDPTQQLGLAAAADALEDSGLLERDFDRSRCAVILGNALGGDKRELTTLRVRFPMFVQAMLAAGRDESVAPELMERLLERAEGLFKADLPPITEDTMPGELANVLAGRICNALDLRGPSYTADAACASSLAALDAAVRGLRSGVFDVALTGGVDRCMSPSTYAKFSKIGALSADRSCPFDARADGFVMGEGAAVLVLKRLSDAVAAGDRIYAVVRGVGGASDGRGKGITAPHPRGQQAALRAAFEDAGVAPQTLGLLEAHGTSTRVGDTVEAESFGAIFESERAPHAIRLGSVKSNIGHLKAAAGGVGLFKAAMALHHKVLPPTCSVEEPNPKIDFDSAPLRLQHQAEPWERNGHPRRAGVSSFGFGGTNYHIVLEEYDPERAAKKTYPGGWQRPTQTPGSATTAAASASTPTTRPTAATDDALPVDAIGLSATTHEALTTELERLVDGLRRDGEAVYEAHRLPQRQAVGPVRLALIGASVGEVLPLAERALEALKAGKSFRILENQGALLRDASTTPQGKTAFLFTGQGSQYLNMGADLRDRYPEIDRCFERSDAVLEGQFDKPLSEYVFVDNEQPSDFEALSQTAITQPAVLTLDAALLRIVRRYGVDADLVAGHSLGEYGACFAAGVLTLDEAIRTVAVRGTAMAEAQPLEGDKGVMCSLPLPADQVAPEIEQYGGRVVIANKNSPEQTIIAGFTAEMLAAIEYFEGRGVRTQRLPVSHAFHTEIVSPASGPLRRFLDELDVRAPQRPILTCIDASFYPSDVAAIRDLLSVQLARPVEWTAIIERMYAEGVRTFIEIGPKRALASFVSSTLSDRPHRAYISNHPKQGGPGSIARLVGGLWADGLLAAQPEAPSVGRRPGASVDSRSPEVADVDLVVTGAAVGLPGQSEVFDDAGLKRLLEGENLIGAIPEAIKQRMVDKRITRLNKTADGRADMQRVDSPEGALQLAGQAGHFDLSEFGLPPEHAEALDRASQLAVAAMVEALKDARLPLVPRYRTTKGGKKLSVGYALPESLRDDTGIIFCSAFAGTDAAIAAASATREGADFDRRFVRQLIVLGHGAAAQWIGARGPNVMINTACASTTSGVALACDWLRLGRARRVIVVGADDATNSNGLMEWIGSGFLAMGAATTESRVDRAALPFDRRRSGLVLGMGAVGLVIERRDDVDARGVAPIANVLSTHMANSAGHPTRLDPSHLAEAMVATMATATRRSGRSAAEMAADTLFVSHETYTPARGGSASGEVAALRAAFGEGASQVLITNVKGLTGHPMGATLEEAIAVKALQYGVAPPVANHREIDPELGPLTLSRGEHHDCRYSLRLAAGFGSQVAMTAYEREATGEERIADRDRFTNWLVTTCGGGEPMALEIRRRNLIAQPSDDEAMRASIDAFEASRRALAPVPVVAPPVLEPHQPAAPATTAGGPPGGGMLSWANTVVSGQPEGSDDTVQEATVPSETSRVGRTALTRDEAYRALLEELCEKTGYEHDEIEPDFELEPDLGVDTVKQAEIMAAVRERFGLERDEDFRLADYPTLANLAGYLVEHSANGRHDAPAVDTLAAAPSAGIGAAESRALAYEALLSELCEKTGYDADEIESDFELEADLGVDTVKQAEIMAAVRERFGLERDEEFRLADYPTLHDLAGYLAERMGSPNPVTPTAPVTVVASEHAPSTSPERLAFDISAITPAPDSAPAQTPVTTVSGGAASHATAYRALLDELCQKTGYDPQEIEPDFELEADLGVDTVKQAEIMAAVRERFALERDEEFRLVDYPTLDDLARYLSERMGGTAPAAPAPEAPVSSLAPSGAGRQSAPTSERPVFDITAITPPAEPAAPVTPERPQPSKASNGAGAGMLSWASTALDTPDESQPQVASEARATAPRTANSAAPLVDRATAYQALLDELCAKTGYDPNEIEPDFELEADLGVDTVKQAEIMAAVRERFELERDEDFRLADHPTLDDLAGYLVERMALASRGRPEGGAPTDHVEAGAPTGHLEGSAPTDHLEGRAPSGHLDGGARPLAVGEFGPHAVNVAREAALPADRRRLERLLGGRSVALVEVDRALRSSIADALSGLSARSFVVDAETEDELASALTAQGDPGRLAIVTGLGASLGDPVYAGTQLFRLARVLARLVPDGGLAQVPWLSLTRSGGLLGLDGGGGPTAGVVSGMTKALAREWNNPHVRVLDLADETTNDSYGLDLLTQAFLGDQLESGFAYGQRIIPIEQPAQASAHTVLGANDVVLVTGGARGITACVAIAMAERFGCRLALVGRTAHEPPGPNGYDLKGAKVRLREQLAAQHDRVTPAMVREALRPLEGAVEIEETLQAIRQRGVEATYVACDVTERSSVRDAIETVVGRWGRIDGIIHGAGIEVSKALLDKEERSAQRVIETKVVGAANLLWALRDQPLRLVVGFGSVVGRFGNAGQVEYAGSNDGLAKMLARLGRQRPDVQALTIDWTAWDDVGMAVNSGVKSLMLARGIDLLPADRGVDICLDLLESGARGEVVVAKGLGDLRQLPGHQNGKGPGPGGGNGSGGGGQRRPSNNGSNGHAYPAPRLSAAAGLLESIEVSGDGRSARASVQLDPSEPFLNDHRIDGTPVLPGVMALEMCAELGRRLAGERAYRGVSDMRFERPAKLHRDEPLRLSLEAECLDDGADGSITVEVRVSSEREGRTGRSLRTDHFSGRLRFGGPAAERRRPLSLKTVEPISGGVERSDIYDRFFHTGTFAIVDRLVALGDRLVVGEGHIGPAPLSSRGADLISDPLVTELAFQVAGLHGLMDGGTMLLPARIGRSELHRQATTGDRLTARVAIRAATDTELVFDADIVDDEARILSRYSEVALVNAGRDSARRLVAPPLEVSIARLEQSDVPAELLSHPERLAGASELAAYARKKVDKARREWVTSRYLVKREVAAFYRQFYGVALGWHDIEVSKDEYGAPFVRVSGSPDSSAKPPFISITHSAHHAMVALVPPWRKLLAGIDLERVEERSDRFVADSFSAGEQARAQRHPQPASVLTAMWSLKEAASKALGLGMHLDFRTEIEVVDLTADGARLAFSGRARERMERLGMDLAAARWSVEDGFAAASVQLHGPPRTRTRN